MAQSCTVCTHADRHAIEKSMVDGLSNRRIATQYGLTEPSVRRHKTGHLPQVLAESARTPQPVEPTQPTPPASIQEYATQRQATDRSHALDLMGQLSRQVQRVNDLSDACDAWLRDPEDASRYDISPRADDVMVVYHDLMDRNNAGNPRRKKDTLAALLARVDAGEHYAVQHTETRVADPRELLLKAADGVRGQMQLLVMVLDRLYNAQEIEAFQSAVLDAIAEVSPDVRAAIEDKLRQRRPLRRALN